MAFTMPVLKNTEPTVGRWIHLLWLLLAVMPAMAEADFRVLELSPRFEEGVLVADARLDYRLTAPVVEALESGVSVVISQTLRLQRLRWWWRNARVVLHERRHRLQYHAISRRYVLTRLDTGESRSFRNLDALLLRLGRVEAWPVIAGDRLAGHKRYRLGLSTALETDPLPRLLRTRALIDDQWQIASGVRYQQVVP